MSKEQEYIDLTEQNIILKIPTNTVALTLHASIVEGDSLQRVEKRLDLADIITARKDFLDNVEDGDDYDAVYAITDEGRAWLEQLEKERGANAQS